MQAADGLRLHAVVGIGLGHNLVGATEAVEVVDIEGAEIDLQRLEHIRQTHPLAFHLGTIDHHIELRGVDVKAGEQSGHLA
ncbi:hypothetical protein D3C77_399570 [compost metagenome]